MPRSLPPAIPRGVADLFGGAAVAKRQAEAALRELARRWGYVEVIPPTFEYAETLAAEAGTQLAEELYRFLDRDGHALALRPDLTIPTARIAGSKLFDQSLPQRLFYAGPVFRYEEPRAGRQREFWQVGIELIGAGSADADAEVLAFAAIALRDLCLPVIRLTLGHLGYFHGLLQTLNLSSTDVQQLHAALDRKSSDDLEAFVGSHHFPSQLNEAVLGLLDLSGDDPASVIRTALALSLTPEMTSAANRLGAVLERLEHFGVASHFALDLADVRGMDYYTGITFKAYTSDIGFSVLNGGRYDNLVGHFGPPQPAVGCAFYLDRILLARTRRRGPVPDPAPDYLVQACVCGNYVRIASHARDAGRSVAVALGPESVSPGQTVVRCGCDGLVYVQAPSGSCCLSPEDWLLYVDSSPS